MTRLFVALCCAVVVAGCGRSTTTTGAPNSSQAAQSSSGGAVSGQLAFDTYVLQLSIPIGTTTFPHTTSQGAVAFYNGNDSTQEWSVGTNVSKTAAGTVTISAGGKSGTIDADMLPDTPHPNPALEPIHVKGTFTRP